MTAPAANGSPVGPVQQILDRLRVMLRNVEIEHARVVHAHHDILRHHAEITKLNASVQQINGEVQGYRKKTWRLFLVSLVAAGVNVGLAAAQIVGEVMR